jgi:hypothetical protein
VGGLLWEVREWALGASDQLARTLASVSVSGDCDTRHVLCWNSWSWMVMIYMLFNIFFNKKFKKKLQLTNRKMHIK